MTGCAALALLLGPAPSAVAAEGPNGGGSGGTAGSTQTPAPLPTTSPFEEPIGGAELNRPGTLVQTSSDTPPLPVLTARSFLIADMDSGDIYAANGAHTKSAGAETLLPLTALTLLPRLDARAIYTLTRADETAPGDRAGLRLGTNYQIDQLFRAMFLSGARDAATGLVNAAGGDEQVAELMAAEARRIGAYDTTVDAALSSGAKVVTGEERASSAYDLALVTKALFDLQEARQYAQLSSMGIAGKDGKPVQLHNADDLAPRFEGATGLNIDSSGPASTVSLGSAEQNGRHLVVVVLGSDAPAAAAAADLLEWGFAAADTVEPVGQLVSPDQVQAAADRKAASTADSTPTPTELASAAEEKDDPVGAAARTLVSGPLLPLWLWAIALVFVVLATIRVRSVIRSRRKGDTPPPSS